MPNPAPDLNDLAAALADGDEVDWDAAEAAARTPQDRRQVRHLRLLARVADAYRTSSDHWNAATGHRHAPLERGATWDGLEILERIGAGTFGEVYRALDPRLDREVALKLLHAPASPTSAGAIVEEGRLLARIRHANVVSVFGADRFDGRVGIWMELVEGRTLEDEVRERGALTAEDTTRIGVELSRALSAVHGVGLLHRDVKAQNVMRDRHDGRIVLMDFSAGRESGAAAAHGLPVSLAGSPIYLAPEILDGQPASPRSDIYSLGVLLYRLASGAFPVTGESLADIRQAHTSGTRTALAERRPDLPPALVRVVDKAIDPDPALRFDSAHDVEAALGAVVDRQLARARVLDRRWWARVVALVLVAAAGLGLFARLGREQPSTSLAGARDWVLVSDIENKASNSALGESVTNALAKTLDRSRVVRVVPRAHVEQLLALMRQTHGRPVDMRTAREIAQRDGSIRAIVTGAISLHGSSPRLTLNVTRPGDGVFVASVVEDIDTNAVARSIARATAALAAKLSAVLPSMPQSGQLPEVVTTSSLQALQQYSKAAALISEEHSPGDQEHAAAEVLLREAVTLDPSFASAWYLLARTALARHAFTKDYRPFIDKAVALSDGVSDVERYRILGWWHRRRNDETGDLSDLARAAPMYEALLAAEPTDAYAAHSLEQVYLTMGRQNDADGVVLRAAAARPDSLRLAVRVAQVELRRGRLNASRAMVTRVLDAAESDLPDRRAKGTHTATPALTAQVSDLQEPAESDVAWAHLWNAHVAWLAGNAEEALVAAHLAQAQWHGEGERARTQWGWHLAFVYEGLGRFRDAETVIREFWDPSFRNRDLAHLAVLRGDLTQARTLLEQHRTFEDANNAATLLVWAGLLDHADWVTRERRTRGIAPAYRQQAVDEGLLRVAQGRYVDGVRLLEPLVPAAAPGGGIYLAALEGLAVARRALGDVDGAIALLEPLDRTRAVVVSGDWEVHSWLRCRVLLAELHRQAGRHGEADRVSEQVHRLLVAADPGHPLLARLDNAPDRAELSGRADRLGDLQRR